MKITYDDIDPPGIYIKFTDEKEYNTLYIGPSIVHVNKDKEGNLCSIMIIMPEKEDTMPAARETLKEVERY